MKCKNCHVKWAQELGLCRSCANARIGDKVASWATRDTGLTACRKRLESAGAEILAWDPDKYELIVKRKDGSLVYGTGDYLRALASVADAVDPTRHRQSHRLTTRVKKLANGDAPASLAAHTAGKREPVLILDLCGGTGSWSQPYAEAGYRVEIVDIQSGQDARLFRRIRGVHGILAAPVCTVFSYARNRYPPTDAELLHALSLVDACLRIIFAHREVLKWWALENPVNKLRRYLGPPRLTFRQWEYGDAGHKPTGIWGDFVAPPKTPTPRRKASTFRTSQENASPGDAVTPAGFARAFFEANP